MSPHCTTAFFLLFVFAFNVHGYFLVGERSALTVQRLDPLVSPGKVSGHVHRVLGGSNFRMNSTTTASLRNSDCTSMPIAEDKSNYWFPHLYFQWANGSFTSLDGGAVIYYLFGNNPGTTTAFPDDFRMLSGDPTLRTYDPTSYAQQAVTFLCLDFNGVSTRYNSLPPKACPSGIRAQINFPSCWDGKNLDSPDHKSHVAFLSGGPDSGTCSDPKYPVTLPRIFIEMYWSSNSFDSVRSQAMDPSQPFVYSYGDPTGYGYHADFINGWDKGVLQKVVDNCHCNNFGDPTCCVNQGLFSMNTIQHCRITNTVDEPTTGTLAKLPGNNPVQKAGVRAMMYSDPNTPTLLSPVYAYTGDTPPAVGAPVSSTNISPITGGAPPSLPNSLNSSISSSAPSPTPPVHSSSAAAASSNQPPKPSLPASNPTLNGGSQHPPPSVPTPSKKPHQGQGSTVHSPVPNSGSHPAPAPGSHASNSPPSSSPTVVQSTKNGNGSTSSGTKCKPRRNQPRSLHPSHIYHNKARRLIKAHGWAS